MTKRPWTIRFLAALLIFGPFLYAAVGAWSRKMPFSEYSLEFLGGPRELVIGTLIGLPLMGLSLYSMKRWSYAVFFICGALVLAETVRRLAVAVDPDRYWAIGISFVVAVVAGGFFAPVAHVVFYNPKLKWWESLSRYRFHFPVTLEGRGRLVSGMILNASEGGLLVAFDHGVDLPDDNASEPIVRFKYKEGHAFALRVRRAHFRTQETNILTGFEFVKLSSENQKALREFAREMQRDGVPLARPEPRFWRDLFAKIRGKSQGHE